MSFQIFLFLPCKHREIIASSTKLPLTDDEWAWVIVNTGKEERRETFIHYLLAICSAYESVRLKIKVSAVHVIGTYQKHIKGADPKGLRDFWGFFARNKKCIESDYPPSNTFEKLRIPNANSKNKSKLSKFRLQPQHYPFHFL